MTSTEVIRDFYGRIIGKIDTLDNGDRIAKDFYGRIVGKYIKSMNVTRDFYGRIIAKGDSVVSTLYNNQYTSK